MGDALGDIHVLEGPTLNQVLDSRRKLFCLIRQLLQQAIEKVLINILGKFKRNIFGCG
jgi:hypothetical protein